MEKKVSPEEVSAFSHPHLLKLCGLCGAGCPVPVFLVSCGHCFCLGCLESFWQQLPNCEKPCPTCTLPRESQESLRQHPLQCNLCPVHHPCTARWSCLTCGESYCPEHFQPHMLEEESGGVSLAGHHVCDAAGEEARRMRSGTRRCPQHRDRLVEMYCGICRVCICTLCPLLGSHKGHPVTLIQQEAMHKKGIVNNSSSVKGADKLKLPTIIRAVESHLEQLTEHITEEQQEVRNSDKQNKEKKHLEGKLKEKNLTNRCLEQLDQKTINVLGNIQNIEQAATELKAHTLASKDSILSKFTELRLLLEEEETFAKKYIDDKAKMVLWAYDGQIETCQDQIKVIDKISTKVKSIHQQPDDIKLIEDYTASEREIGTSMAPAEQWHPVPVTFEHLENYYGSFTETFKSIFKEPLTTRLQKDTFSGLGERATQEPGTLIKTGSFVDRSLFLKHARCPTLDPNTMHPKLRLSEDLLTVNCAWLGKFNSNHPQRFDKLMQILSRDSYFSGTHYWEVDVLQAGQGWWIGVTYPSIQRKGDSEFSRLGWTSGSWCIKRFDHEYWAFHKGERKAIHLNHHPEKIGVFLDYECGVLSFFDVTAGMRHLHTFRCRFTEPLYPALRLWDGSVTICRLT